MEGWLEGGGGKRQWGTLIKLVDWDGRSSCGLPVACAVKWPANWSSCLADGTQVLDGTYNMSTLDLRDAKVAIENSKCNRQDLVNGICKSLSTLLNTCAVWQGQVEFLFASHIKFPYIPDCARLSPWPEYGHMHTLRTACHSTWVSDSTIWSFCLH